MINFQNATIARGGKPLIKNINFTVFAKNVIGIVGANGCGKTSLFAAVQGELETSAGEISAQKGLRIAALEQEVTNLELSAIDYTLLGNAVLFQVLQDLEKAEKNGDHEKILDAHAQLHDLDGYGATARAAKILHGLGFSEDQYYKIVKEFSGGWRMRLNIAKCLFASSDILLLDEPTNHLDMETILWLENFLKNYSGCILLVSHDQSFLDNVVTQIAHIENNEIKLYSGNFSKFEILRAESITLQNSAFRKQQQKIAHTMKFVDRFGSKASKAKQAQSRLRALEKLELIRPIYDKSPFHFSFLPAPPMPNPMLTLKKVSLGYGDITILQQVELSISAGQRIGLLGVNGAGKSTLIKGICGEIAPQTGTILRPGKLTIGYFAQHQLDYLPIDGTAMEIIRDLDRTKTDKELLSYLGSFAFDRDQALSPFKNFSGGEKARFALALIIWQRPNLLLLDEPTNHLDIEMRQALAFALEKFTGAMILVSHDRFLLQSLVDELYIVKGKRVSQFAGSVEDYAKNYSD